MEGHLAEKSEQHAEDRSAMETIMNLAIKQRDEILKTKEKEDKLKIVAVEEEEKRNAKRRQSELQKNLELAALLQEVEKVKDLQ